MSELATRAWFLTGPTASGKTALGLELAEKLDAEILSLDSMALYRGMDIGTAKPTAEERSRVPHHLLDLFEPHEETSLAQYRDLATAQAAEIFSRGKGVLFVGGTPLYLKALLRGMFDGPPADQEFRERIIRDAQSQPPGWLHAQVALVDPPAARKLHPNDERRLVRALEVFEKTGRPISDWQQQFDQSRAAHECRVFALSWPREELLARIDQRVDAMFASGLVEETAALRDRAAGLSKTARQAVGYREVFAHLSWEQDLLSTIQLVKNRTHQFARHQRTWFRSLTECRTVEMTAARTAKDLVAEILDRADRGT